MASGVTTSLPVSRYQQSHFEYTSAVVSYKSYKVEEESAPPSPAPQPSTAWHTPHDFYYGSHTSLVFNLTSQHDDDIKLTSHHDSGFTSQRLVFPTRVAGQSGPSYYIDTYNETYDGNDTPTWYDVTTNSTTISGEEDALHWVRMISLQVVLLGLSLITSIGNAMVLHAVRTERRLQSVSLINVNVSFSSTVSDLEHLNSSVISPKQLKKTPKTNHQMHASLWLRGHRRKCRVRVQLRSLYWIWEFA